MKYLSITESTVQVLRERIITGAIEGGSRLNENRLAAELGVSRPPLREALRTLENEKLVESIPRIGTFATEVSLKDFESIHEIRIMAELFAIDRLKAKNRRDLADLEKSQKSLLKQGVPEYLVDADPDEKVAVFRKFARFHIQLVEAAQNDYLTHWYQSLASNIARYQYLYFFQPGIAEKDLDDHIHMLALIKNGKFDEVRDLMHTHLSNQRVKMRETLKRLSKG